MGIILRYATLYNGNAIKCAYIHKCARLSSVLFAGLLLAVFVSQVEDR